MRQFGRFALEVVVVGLAFLVLYTLVSLVIPESSGTTHKIAAPFVAGALGHILFELVGANQFYADYKAK